MAELRLATAFQPALPRPRVLLGLAGGACAAGALAALGWSGAALVLLAGMGLLWAGTRLAWIQVQTVALLVLLLVPEAASGRTFGLRIPWSNGLTWPNFAIPALLLPLLAGAWWSGRTIWPRRFPRFAAWMLALLGWSLLTLVPVWVAGAITLAGTATVLAHVAKLTLFVLLGVMLLPDDSADPAAAWGRRPTGGGGTRPAQLQQGEGGEAPGKDRLCLACWRRRAGRCLILILAVNAAIGLGQAWGRLPVFSQLAQGQLGARATGLFFDANFYAIAIAWALLWLLCQPLPNSWRCWAALALVLAVAGNLVAAGSRAGYAAFLVGAIVLGWSGHRRALVRAAVLLAAMLLLFPVRSWQRARSAAATVMAVWQPATLVAGPQDASTAARLGTMHEALRQIARHPLLGLGFGRALYLGVPARGAGPVVLAPPFRGAQDMPLTVLAGTGPAGLALLLLAAGAPLGPLLRRASRLRYAPLLAGYVGLLTACLTQEVLWNARLLLLVVLLTAGTGLGAGASPPSSVTREPAA